MLPDGNSTDIRVSVLGWCPSKGGTRTITI
jgi:hypothetical protein